MAGLFDDVLAKPAGLFDDVLAAKPAKQIDFDAPIGEEGFFGGVKELGRGVARGAMTTLPEQVGGALQFFGAEEAGKAVSGFAERMKAEAPKESVTSQFARQESPFSVRGGAAGAGENIPLSFAPGAAGAAIGAGVGAAFGGLGAIPGAALGFAAGQLGALPIFYGGSAHETQQKVEKAQLAAGATPEVAAANARTAAHASGAINAIGELAANIVPVGAMLKPFAKPVAGAAVRSIFAAPVMGAAKTLAKTEVGEVATEMAQQAGQAAVEGAYGAGPGATWEDTASVIMPTAIMSLFPGGVAAGHNIYSVKKAESVLADPTADPDQRAAAAAMVVGALRTEHPGVAKAFDSYAADKIASQEPVELTDDTVYTSYDTTRLNARLAALSPENAAREQQYADMIRRQDAYETNRQETMQRTGIDPSTGVVGAAAATAVDTGAAAQAAATRQTEVDQAGHEGAVEAAAAAAKPGEEPAEVTPPAPGPGAPGKLFPFSTPEGALARIKFLQAQTGVEHVVVPHPTVHDAFAVVPKPPEVPSAVQEPGATGVLPRPQEGTGEAGGERGGVGPSIQGPETAGQGQVTGPEAGAQVEGEPSGETPAVGTDTGIPQDQVDAEGTGGVPPATTATEAETETPVAPAVEQSAEDLFDEAAAEVAAEGVTQPPAAGGENLPPAGEGIIPATPTDQAAHEGATSPTNELPEPTGPQLDAGNYKMGPLKVGPLDISVENPETSQRSNLRESDLQAIADAIPTEAPEYAMPSPAGQPALPQAAHQRLTQALELMKSGDRAGALKLAQQAAHNLGMSSADPNTATAQLGRQLAERLKTKWASVIKGAHYGYIKGTKGRDKEHIDTFVKPGTPADHAGPVFVIDQLGATGEFDEHKVMLGYADKKEAINAYKANYPKDFKVGPVHRTTLEEFNTWARDPAKTQRAFAGREEAVEQPLPEVANPMRFFSGMTRPGDFTTTLAANQNIGIAIQELSTVSIPKLALSIASSTGHVFVDTGAYSLFTADKIQPGFELEPGLGRGIDFKTIFDRYEELARAVSKADEENGGAAVFRLWWTMPDLVGNQTTSLQLLRDHLEDVKAHLGFGNTIIPLQIGELSLAEAYDEVVQILGRDDFIVGIPSNKRAVTDEQFREFIAARGKDIAGVHLLGSAAESRIEPRLEILRQAQFDGHVSADANRLRALMYGESDRAEALRKLLAGDQTAAEKKNALAEAKAAKEAKEAEKARAKLVKQAHRTTQADVYTQLKDDPEIVAAVRAGKSEEVIRGKIEAWVQSEIALTPKEDPRAEALNAFQLTPELLASITKAAGKVAAKEDAAKKAAKPPPAKKLQNTGEDLRRHWELEKAKLKAKNDAEGITGMNRIFASTARADQFADLLAPDATLGAQRTVELVRDSTVPFKKWLSEFGPLSRMTGTYRLGETERVEAFITGKATTYTSTPEGGRELYRGVVPDAELDAKTWLPDQLTVEQRLGALAKLADEWLGHVRTITDVLRGKSKAAEVVGTTLAKDGIRGLLWQKVPGHWDVTSDVFLTATGQQLFKDDILLRSGLQLLASQALERAGANETEETGAGRKQPLRHPRLEKIERSGLPELRGTRNVTSQEVKDTFGFADVGFGDWVVTGEDQQHLNHAYDAFLDLAHFVGIDPTWIGFKGRLHFTLGALGHGSKAAATFHRNHPGPSGPVQVINLTKTTGDGTVSHEWLHALDYFLRLTGSGDQAMRQLVAALKVRHDNYQDVYDSAMRGLDKQSWMVGNKRAGPVENAQDLARWHLRHPKESRYKTNADTLGSDYWGNDAELPARAWEAWVLDTLPGRNTYLVNPWVGDSVAGPPLYRGIPYPVGDERKVFGEWFKALTTSLKTDGAQIDVDLDKWEANRPKHKEDFKAQVEQLIADMPRIHAERAQQKQEEAAAKAAAKDAEARASAEAAAAERRAEAEAARAAAEAAAQRDAEKLEPPPPTVTTDPLTPDAMEQLFDEAAEDVAAELGENSQAPEAGEPALNNDATVTPDKHADRWHPDDIAGLIKKLEEGKKLLFAGNDYGLPAIQSVPGANHIGFGMFSAKGPGWAIDFDAGGAMQRTPHGISYTTISESEGSYPYNKMGVILQLQEIIDAGKPKAPAAVEPTASKLIAEAAKQGVTGIDEALKGLTKLFGGGKIQSFPGGFDEKTYQEAKPHFEAALKAFQAAGKTLKDLFKLLIQQMGLGVKPYALRFVEDMKLTASLGQQQSASRQLAEWVKGELNRPGAEATIAWPALFGKANEIFGGTQAEGKYSPKDAYDAAEAGMNLWLLQNPAYYTAQNTHEARSVITHLKNATNRMPTQTKRTGEQDEFQQFSTVPALAWAANWVANVHPGETYLEPSAGIGGLAVFGQLAGANLVLNELSSRRAAVLKEVLPDARYFTENAEQIHNILPDDVVPTVVVMNPPFSSTAGRVPGQRDTMNGARHVEQALLRLAPGGRLVAIVGDGMSEDHATFKDWWKGIKQKYNVRANLGVNGAEYAKYGTTFDNRLLVIDKTGPTIDPVVTTRAEAYSELPALLAPIRELRHAPQARDLTPQPESVEPGGPPVAPPGVSGPGTAPPPVTGPVGGGQPPQPGGSGRTGVDTDTGGPGQGPAVGGNAPGTPGGRPPVGPGAGGGRGGGGGGRPGAGGDRGKPESEPVTGEGEVTLNPEAIAQRDRELTDSVYEEYTPQKAVLAGSKPHPGTLVESAAMASVEPIDATYVPNLTKDMVEGGKVSAAQIEPIIYAGQQHQKFNPDGTRQGYLIGDGTGVGKGREIAAIIIDNIRRGIKKHVWISAKSGLLKDAKRDMKGAGGNDDAIFGLNTYAADKKIDRNSGVLFTTYDTLKSAGEAPEIYIAGDPVVIQDPLSGGSATRPMVKYSKAKSTVTVEERNGKQVVVPFAQITSIKGQSDFVQRIENRKGPSRLDQIVQWLGKDYDGVIAFDEAHYMGNLGDDKVEGSQRAMAGVQLQELLPNARVVYVTATAATEVSNLMYAPRLGLWGDGTAFSGARDFVAKISSAGLAAMELVARDMKRMGKYIARSLSYDGVEFDRKAVPLTAFQSDAYNAMAKAWQQVLDGFNEAMETTGQRPPGSKRYGGDGQFWGAQQRFFNQVITSMMVPSIVESAQRDLAEGKSVVFQLVNTGESGQAREERRLAEEGGDLEEMDLSPRQILEGMVEEYFPTQEYEEYTDDKGKKRVRAVVDSNGDPVQSKEALEMKAALLKELKALFDAKPVGSPLDMLIEGIGHENFAEITGRKKRFVRIEQEDGSFKVVEQKRGSNANQADAAAFQDGKKRALAFSDAGGTGFSFHSDRGAKNQQRRVHYLVQPGWRADNAVQGFGRSHRSNEANQPFYWLVHTDLQAQKRFITSIARRLDQLGALTKGQRNTGSSGLFTNRDNLESKYGTQAVGALFNSLNPNVRHADFPDARRIIRAMALESIYDPKTGMLAPGKVPPVTKFLNRLLMLEISDQNRMFTEFERLLDAGIDQAIERGTFDDGMQTVKAINVTKTRDEIIHTDTATGADTRYVELELTHNTILNDWNTVQTMLQRYPGRGLEYYRDNITQQPFVVVDLGSRVGSDGKVQHRGYRFNLKAPSLAQRGSYIVNLDSIRAGGRDKKHYSVLDEIGAAGLWDAALDTMPKTYTDQLTMLEGALLPVWDRIQGENSVSVVRTQTDAGERLLGMTLHGKHKEDVLAAFKVAKVAADIPVEVLVDRVLGGEVAKLSNHWRLKKVRVSNEDRIEISNPSGNFTADDIAALKRAGLIEEKIGWQYRYFIPAGEKQAEVFEAVTRGNARPVVDFLAKSSDKLSLGAASAVAPKASVPEVQQAIQPLVRKWRNAPRIHVVQSVSQLPGNPKPAMTRGVYNSASNTVYLVADNTAPDKAQFVLAHEVLGHFGLAGILGDQLDPLMDYIYRSNPAVRRMADARIKDAASKGRQYSTTLGTEEALADLAGQNRLREVNGWKLLVAAIRKALREIGFDLDFSENDILALLANARAYVEAPSQAAAQSKPRFAGMGPLAADTGMLSLAGQTAAFRAWFGDSKVVDEAGAPLVVHHQTHEDFSIFDRHFATKRFQRDPERIDTVGTWFTDEPSRRMYGPKNVDVYLSIKDPLVLRDDAEGVAWLQLEKMVKDAGGATALRTELEKAGLDGVKLENTSLDGAVHNVWIALEPTQIKSADNLGGFDPANPDIRYSLDPAQQLQQLLDRQRRIQTGVEDLQGEAKYAALREIARQLAELDSGERFSLVEDATNYIRDTLLRSPKKLNPVLKGFQTQFHKAQQHAGFRQVFQETQAYLRDISSFATAAADFATGLLPKLGRAADLKPKWMGGVGRAAPKDVAAVSRATFAATLADLRPTKAQLLAGFTAPIKYGKTLADIEVPPLTETQADLFQQARLAIDRSIDQMAVSQMTQIATGHGISEALAAAKNNPDIGATLITTALQEKLEQARVSGNRKAVAQLQADIEKVEKVAADALQLEDSGYAPLMRFGQYTLKVEEVVEQAPTLQFFGMFESKRELYAMEREMREQYPNAVITPGTLDRSAFQTFRGLNLSALETFAHVTGMKEDEAYQAFYREAVASRSALKHLIHRKGIAGYSEDLPRVLASFITSSARLASKNYHFAAMNQGVHNIAQEEGDVRTEAAELVNYVQNPVEEAPKLRGLLFVNFIGGSVASALTNLTQTTLMTAPWLSQFSNPAAAAAKVLSAMKLGSSIATDKDLREALKRAELEGVTDPQEIHQLYAESIRGIGTSLWARKGLRVWGAMFSLAESFNRRVTFTAAFQTAQERGIGSINAIRSARGEAPFKDAYDFAEYAVESTQGIYNRGNRPNYARGPIGATIFTFKQFTIAYLEFLARLPAREKLVAASLLMLATGLQGAPGADDLEDLIDTIGQLMGYNTNSKKFLREKAAEHLGDTFGGLLTHGVSTSLPFDVQGRLSFSNIIPGTALFKQSDATRRAEEIAEVAGPLGGLYKQGTAGFEALVGGNVTGFLSSAAPVAVQNAMKGLDMWTSGMYKDARGGKIVDVDKTDAMFKFIGIQPESVAGRQRVESDVMQSVALVRVKESAIADQWARAILDKDEAGIRDAVRQLHEWNTTNPEWPIQITPYQIRQRVQSKMLERGARILKAAPKEVRATVRRELQ